MTWAIEVAARTLLQEARGEPPEGRQAVAHVLLNRLKDGRWGASLATVCLWPAQFSGWHNQHDPNFSYACNLADTDPALASARAVIQAAMNQPDPTHGALFYYAPAGMPDRKAPFWVAGMFDCGKFGTQLFFTDRAKGALTS